MTIRCKFRLDSIKRIRSSNAKRDENGVPIKDDKGNYTYENGEAWSLELHPVYGNGDQNHENTKFWAATPSGKLELSTVNSHAVDTLELGGEYYIDITPAQK